MAEPPIPLTTWVHRSAQGDSPEPSARPSLDMPPSSDDSPLPGQSTALQQIPPLPATTSGSQTTVPVSMQTGSQLAQSTASTPQTTITTPSAQSPSPEAPGLTSSTSPHTMVDSSSPSGTTYYAAVTHTKRPLSASIQYWLKPLLAIVIYCTTLGVAFSASSRYTVLARVSASFGTWILTVFAKAGDLAFAIAIADTFDCLAWGKLKKRHVGVGGPQRMRSPKLDWFLALVSSTGLTGLILLIRENFSFMRKRRRASAAVHWSFEQRLREIWKDWRTVRWSLARLAFLALLIPGPGIILLASVEQKEVFIETRSLTVSAGLAPFDPDLATAASPFLGPAISRLASMMLVDPAISWPVKAVDPLCKVSKTCTSYLIAGPYRTIQPSPFTVENDDISGFILYDAPFYHVDMWNVEPESVLAFNETRECELYGGYDARNEFSMKICMKQHAQDVVVAGWKSCQDGYDNITRRCLEPGSLPGGKYGWTTYLHFYRRNAAIVFSRSSFTILDVSDLSIPQSENIPAASLFTAMNAMLYRPNQTENSFQYDRLSARYILTQNVGADMWWSLHGSYSGLLIGKDWLRNLLAMPVYVFQPTVTAAADYLRVRNPEDGTTPLQNLPQENYVRGSYCIVDKRSVPGTKTVIGYACVAGFLLLFVVMAKWTAFRWPVMDTSNYPLLDYEALTQVENDLGNVSSLRDGYGPSQKTYCNSDLVKDVHALRLGLRPF